MPVAVEDGAPAVREFGVWGPVHAVRSAGFQLQAGQALVAARRDEPSTNRRVNQSEHVPFRQKIVPRPLSQRRHQFRSIGQVTDSFYRA